MAEMTEHQAKHAMELLARLYAERKAFNNPKITIHTKDEKGSKRNA